MGVHLRPFLWTLVYQILDQMNKILLITFVCFLANTQGSPRTRRALPPSYLSIPGHTECLDSQTLPGDSHSGKCIPAIKPAYCSEAAWADLALDSGLDACYGGIEAYSCTADAPATGGTAPAECQFPFTYDDRTYNECTYYKTANEKAWCRTVTGALGDCNPGCPGI